MSPDKWNPEQMPSRCNRSRQVRLEETASCFHILSPLELQVQRQLGEAHILNGASFSTVANVGAIRPLTTCILEISFDACSALKTSI